MSPKILLADNISQEKLLLQSDTSRFNLSFEYDLQAGHKNLDRDCCAADELFSNGKILPMGIKKKAISSPKQKIKDQSTQSPHDVSSKKGNTFLNRERLNEANVSMEEEDVGRYKRLPPINHSNSLSCERYKLRFCRLRLLFRSKSVEPQETLKQSRLRKPDCGDNRSSNSPERRYQRGYTWARSNSQANNAALNIPLADIFCFGSGFSNDKEKRK